MNTKYGVVKFSTGEFAGVVLGEAENEREAEIIPVIQWAKARIVGDYCAPCGSRVFFISPLQDSREEAEGWAKGVATRIDQVIENEILETELAEDRVIAMGAWGE